MKFISRAKRKALEEKLKAGSTPASKESGACCRGITTPAASRRRKAGSKEDGLES